MKRFLTLLLLLCAPTVYAFDSSQAFNVATMSYTANTSIYQRIVLSADQKASNVINFSVDVKNGGGRPTMDLNGVPQAYASQTDSAYITIKVFDHSGGQMYSQTSQTYTLQNWGSNAGWSARPGDNLQPWTTASVSFTGDLTYARYIEVWMTGTDGAWWAGNYGPEWRVPTVKIGASTANVVYNPEFGIAPNSAKAQGWFNTSNTWAFCGVTSGSAPCVTNETSVTANMFGGGYDANGGSLAGAPGGYTSTLTTTTADTAATTGSTSTTSTTTPPPPTLCCGGSAAAFNADPVNALKVQTFIGRSTNDSQVYIEQIGTQNKVLVEQTGTKNNYVNYYGNGLSNDVEIKQNGNPTTQVNYTDLKVIGNFNTVKIEQTSTGGGKGSFTDISGNNNSLILKQQDSGSHYAEVTLSGGNKNVDITQTGSAGHMAKVNLSGNPTDLSLTQTGSTQNYYSITHNCATAGGCAKITVTQGQ